MNRIDELICRAEALAVEYMNTWYMENGVEIKDVFTEYFDTVKEDVLVDKRIISSAITIIGQFWREESHIKDEEVHSKMLRVVMWLESTMDCWKPKIIFDTDGRTPQYADELYKKLIDAGNPDDLVNYHDE